MIVFVSLDLRIAIRSVACLGLRMTSLSLSLTRVARVERVCVFSFDESFRLLMLLGVIDLIN